MARIRHAMYSDTFAQLSKEAIQLGENRDCSVKAVAIAGGFDYVVAHDTLAKLGRRKGKGAYTHQITEALRLLGKSVDHVSARHFIERYPGTHSKLQHITSHHPKRFNKVWADGCSYLLFTKRHVFAVVNGVNHDWTVNRVMRVESIYRISDRQGETA